MHRRPQRDRCPAGRRRARDAFITAALCVTIGGEGQQPALRLLSDRILPAGRFSAYHPGFPDGTFQIRARKLTFTGSSVTFTDGPKARRLPSWQPGSESAPRLPGGT